MTKSGQMQGQIKIILKICLGHFCNILPLYNIYCVQITPVAGIIFRKKYWFDNSSILFFFRT